MNQTAILADASLLGRTWDNYISFSEIGNAAISANADQSFLLSRKPPTDINVHETNRGKPHFSGWPPLFSDQKPDIVSNDFRNTHLSKTCR